MDDPIIKEPTQVNARELWLNSIIKFTPIAFAQYAKYDPTYTTLPDGEYSLEFLSEDPRSTSQTPIFYLFNSNKKWTGIVVYLKFFKKKSKTPYKFNLPKDLKDKKYKLISKKGKYEITAPINQIINSSYSEQLTSFFSRKLLKYVQFNKYPQYIPTQNEITKTTGTIVSGDTNQPIKGATIEETD